MMKIILSLAHPFFMCLCDFLFAMIIKFLVWADVELVVIVMMMEMLQF